jgi:hypothetical protein
MSETRYLPLTFFRSRSILSNEFKTSGGLLKNDPWNETTFPYFEPVIEYGQRLCL